MKDQDFTNLGKQIQDAVNDALSSPSFKQVKQTVQEVIDTAAKNTKEYRRQWQAGVRSSAAPAVPAAAPKAPDGAKAVLKTVFGFSIGAVMAVFTITGQVLILAGGLAATAANMASLAASYLVTLGFGVMAYGGTSLLGRRKRFPAYWKALQPQGYGTVKEMSLAANVSEKTVLSDLKYMMRHNFFGECYLDETKSTFMLGRENYERYLHTLEELEARKKEEEALRVDPNGPAAVAAEGKECARKIREVNNALPGEQISQKLDRLELVISKIFNYVELHPEKLPEIRRFINYYLPTTLKLVDSYRSFEEQPVQGSNILSAKKEIENTLDIINSAFENLLNDLFQTDTLDVSSDITALETMLAQEGLTGSAFCKSTEKEN